ncbi:hypothetical protein I4U23_023753 [Adineta vaga]|nr:hypothetical protein I4U23_023753 [Adineta vaga]
MDKEIYIITILNIVILSIIIVLLLIYLLLIILVRRFHTATNILIGGFAVSGIICCGFWVMNNLVLLINPTAQFESTSLCIFIESLPTLVNSLVVYCLIVITINQFFAVIYPKNRFFRKKTCSLISISYPLDSYYYSVNT